MRFNGTSFEVRERVRWADVDASGAIYFGAYVRFVESAETEFYRALGFSFRRFDELGVRLVRVHLEFDFLKPAWLDDELVVGTSVGTVGVHSVRLNVCVKRAGDGSALAEAAFVSSCTDERRKSVPLPEELANALRVHLPA